MDPRFETVQLDGDSSFRALHFKCDSLRKDHSWHYHPELELTQIVKGRGTQFVGDSVVRFKEGDLLMLGAGLPHCWVDDEGIGQENELVVIQFKTDFLSVDFLEMPEALGLKQLFQRSLRGLNCAGPAADKIKNLMWEMVETTGLARLNRLLRALELLVPEDSSQPLTSELYKIDTSEFHGGRMTRVVDYVTAHLGEEIKQTDVAQALGMNPQSFSRFFKTTSGRTFVSFVNVMRIMEACRLLVNTNQEITEIAYNSGYGNLSNFNRQFRELKQITPRQYRELHEQLEVG